MISLRFFPFSICIGAATGVWAGPSLWDGWRGPGRNANVPDYNVPAVWPRSLEQVWSVAVGGGYSSPLVSDGKVYQQARVGGDEVLWCLDAETGEAIWKASTKVDFRSGSGGERHGPGPKSTPTLADGRIFTLSITGTLTAWSAEEGELLWQRDFKERLDEGHPYWGVSMSPLVEDDRLYAHVGSCEKGALFCLDPETGKDIWVQIAHTNCYSSPVVAEVEGVRQLVGFNHDGLCGVDLKTGQVLWIYSYPHEGRSQNTPTPVYHDGLFILGAEDRGMFAVRVSQGKDGWKAEEAWAHREASLDMSSPVVSEGVVYGFSHFKSGQLFGMDPGSGTILWRGEPRSGENASLVAVPGYVLSLTDRGSLQVLRCGGEHGEVVRAYSVGEKGTWTAPSLVEDSIFIKDGDELSRWRVPQG